MIVFVPAYDPPTRANHAVARELPLSPGGIDPRLYGGEATREGLLRALDAHDGPLFAMAHGRPH